MQTYKTKDGDVVDDVVFRSYGALNPDMLRRVFEANPGLADFGPILPSGVSILLPDIAQPTSQQVSISLWD